jgi:hypothetical protein
MQVQQQQQIALVPTALLPSTPRSWVSAVTKEEKSKLVCECRQGKVATLSFILG